MTELATRDDGAIEWRVSAGGDLKVLTSEINDAIDAAESAGEGVALLIRLPKAMPDHSWPSWNVHTDDVSRWEKAVLRLEKSHVATIAVLDGVAGGASFDLLVATSIRVASVDSVLHLPINDGQLWPGMGVYRFVRESSVGASRRALLWHQELDMSTCAALNVVDYTTASLESELGSLLVRVGQISSLEVSLRWNLVREDGGSSADEALGMHLAACNRELRRLESLTTEK